MTRLIACERPTCGQSAGIRWPETRSCSTCGWTLPETRLGYSEEDQRREVAARVWSITGRMPCGCFLEVESHWPLDQRVECKCTDDVPMGEPFPETRIGYGPQGILNTPTGRTMQNFVSVRRAWSVKEITDHSVQRILVGP